MEESPEDYEGALSRWGNAINEIQSKYALIVGQISISWNELHSLFLSYFRAATKLGEQESKKLWECGSSDQQQRNMLRAVSGKIENIDRREDLLWILKQADDLSALRNTLIHAHVSVALDKLEIEVREDTSKANHVNNLKRLQKNDLFGVLNKDIEALTRYAFFALAPTFSEDAPTLLKRPSLKALPLQNQGPSQKTHPGS